jgi:hypothetical protein
MSQAMTLTLLSLFSVNLVSQPNDWNFWMYC